MAEYIEREALAEFLKIEIQQCEVELAESNGEDDRYEQAVESRMIGLVDAWRKVTNTHAADVAEVVRCKDCKHSNPIDTRQAPFRYYRPECIMCYCEEAIGDEPMVYPPTHFCGYGAKMDGKGEGE